jgi:hypothetical protein
MAPEERIRAYNVPQRVVHTTKIIVELNVACRVLLMIGIGDVNTSTMRNIYTRPICRTIGLVDEETLAYCPRLQHSQTLNIFLQHLPKIFEQTLGFFSTFLDPFTAPRK